MVPLPIAHHRIESQPGEGGTGEAYRAIDTNWTAARMVHGSDGLQAPPTAIGRASPPLAQKHVIHWNT